MKPDVSHDFVKDFIGKSCRAQLHRSVDEFVEAVIDLAEDRSIIGILQPQNYANHNGELQ